MPPVMILWLFHHSARELMRVALLFAVVVSRCHLSIPIRDISAVTQRSSPFCLTAVGVGGSAE